MQSTAVDVDAAGVLNEPLGRLTVGTRKMTGLAKYEAARQALADARSMDEVKDIHDKAHAMRLYARMANDTELELCAAEIKVRAERRLGEMIKEQKEGGGLHEGGRPKKTCSAEEQVSELATLADLGIDRKLSARAQKIAAIPEPAFERAIARVRERIAGGERVALNLLANEDRDARQQRRRDVEQALSDKAAELPSGRRFPNIYADPATRFRSGFGSRSIENHYPTLELEQLCALPVKDRALSNARLFIWSTVPQLANTFKIAEAWGFSEYSSHIVWDKTSPDQATHSGTGHVFRSQHELLLYFKRGDPAGPTRGKQALSIYREAKREHSRKPDYFRQMINDFTGGQSVLELFARVDADHPLPPNFTAWGNEAIPHNTAVVDVILAEEPAAIDPRDFDDGLDLPNFLRIGHPENSRWRTESATRYGGS
jgi:N6-adenosine-specific RNA methylase IME4